MPEVRSDMEEERLNRGEGFSGLPGMVKDSLRTCEAHILVLNSLKLLRPMNKRFLQLLTDVQSFSASMFSGRVRKLRALSSWSAVHLSPSYVLFNLTALSIVAGCCKGRCHQ